MSSPTEFQTRCAANLEKVESSLEAFGVATNETEREVFETLTALKRAYEECLRNERAPCAQHVKRRFEAEDAFKVHEMDSFDYLDTDHEMYNHCLSEMAKLRREVVECERKIVKMFA